MLDYKMFWGQEILNLQAIYLLSWKVFHLASSAEWGEIGFVTAAGIKIFETSLKMINLQLQRRHVSSANFTPSTIASNAWIQVDLRWPLWEDWTLLHWSKVSIRTKSWLRLIPWLSISLDPPSKITLDACIRGNYAGGVFNRGDSESKGKLFFLYVFHRRMVIFILDWFDTKAWVWSVGYEWDSNLASGGVNDEVGDEKDQLINFPGILNAFNWGFGVGNLTQYAVRDSYALDLRSWCCHFWTRENLCTCGIMDLQGYQLGGRWL